MLYTGKGDSGSTILYTKGQRLTKDSPIIDALGSLDEISAFLGLCKVKSQNLFLEENLSFETIIYNIQNDLAIIESSIAGSDKIIKDENINYLEMVIKKIEEEIPPIKFFCFSGGTEISALFDIARTLARKAERKVIFLSENKIFEINTNTKKYLNRLSTILFALARLSNFRAGIKDPHPKY